ncbi:hypothetical protein JOD20_005190, partial [Herpetosiphon giganteus]|nr:hypothetical protein [Herpetosiphon giganteus]
MLQNSPYLCSSPITNLFFNTTLHPSHPFHT